MKKTIKNKMQYNAQLKSGKCWYCLIINDISYNGKIEIIKKT